MAAEDIYYGYYDAIFADKDYSGEIERVLSLAWPRPEPARILEIGAGTANHTLVCAGLGHRITAVDIDPRMAAKAGEKLNRQEPVIAERIEYYLGPVEQLVAREFDLALAMFNVVNYLDDITKLQTLLAAVAERLKPAGSFVFDAWNGVAALLDPPQRERRTIETATHVLDLEISPRLNPGALSVDIDYALQSTPRSGVGEERGAWSLKQTLWPTKVIADLALAVGFVSVAIYPLNDQTRQATERDWKVLYSCKKDSA